MSTPTTKEESLGSCTANAVTRNFTGKLLPVGPNVQIYVKEDALPQTPTYEYSAKGRYDPDHEERIEEHNVIVKKTEQPRVVNDLD